jgi:hypothetical protein
MGERWLSMPRVVTGLLGIGIGVFGVTVLRAQNASPAASFNIPYQGYLEEAGAPVEGERHVTFELYPSAQGGNALWTESHTVQVAAGRFSANLGLDTSLDNVMRRGGDLYVAIRIDGVDAGSPVGSPVDLNGRQLLGAVPFARRGAPGKDFIVDGKVGVGTNAPAAEVDVSGDARISGTLRAAGVTFANGTQTAVPAIVCGCFPGPTVSQNCGQLNVDAVLPEGYQITGGGCLDQNGPSGERQILQGYPLNDTTWHCRSQDEDNCLASSLTSYVCGCRLTTS